MGTYFTKKEQIVILIIVFSIVAILGMKIIMGDLIKPNENTAELLNYIEEDDEMDLDYENSENKDIIMVHISGQVYNPGIIELKLGKRVIDAVELAGGLKKEADIDRINLAKKLSDEEKIYIPKIGEEDLSEAILGSTEESTESKKVNINKCTKDELVSLPGIGEVIAERIIEYRKSNTFEKIEDLMNVSGIGTKKFEGLKELIKTN